MKTSFKSYVTFAHKDKNVIKTLCIKPIPTYSGPLKKEVRPNKGVTIDRINRIFWNNIDSTDKLELTIVTSMCSPDRTKVVLEKAMLEPCTAEAKIIFL